MSEITWQRVARALLGRWPSQVAQWGEEGIAAFIEELQADGLTPDRALVAIRSHRPEPGKDFPPSAAAVTALASSDPDRPTFEELLAGLYGPGGLFGFKRSGVVVSPWVEAFADGYGRDRLRMLDIEGPEGHWRRRELEEAWTRFVEASEGREAAALAGRGQGELRRFDPLAALGVRRPEIGAGR